MSRPECAKCGSRNKRGKLLKCLDSLCVECLEVCTNDESAVGCPSCGVITPSPPTGTTQLQSLPDSDVRVSADGGDTSLVTRRMCEECFNDKEAVSICMDCSSILCGLHAEGHSVSRSSHSHKVVALGESGADTAQALLQSSGSNSCPIHPSSKQSRFCMACCKILCGKCEESHGGHCDAIMPIEEAASKAREELKAEVAASFSNDGKGIQEMLDKVEAASAHLHQDTGAVSSQIKEFFTRTKAVLDTRQQQLLDQLDQLQSDKRIPLQELKRHLLSGLSTRKKLLSLIESCHDDSNFMRMYGWLKEAAQEVQSAAGREVQPCVPDTLVFAPCMADTLNDVIGKVGEVVDTSMLSTVESSMATDLSVEEGHDLVISVHARTSDGQDLEVNELHADAIKVHVMSSDNHVTTCPVTMDTESTHRLVAKYKTDGKKRQAQISAICRDHHLKGSPAVVRIIDTLQFTRHRCHNDLALSLDNKTVQHRGKHSATTVRGLTEWTTGRHEFALRIDCQPGTSPVGLCICKNPNASLDYPQGETLFGWRGYDRTPKSSPLHSARAGDVVTMSLDCDNHKLVGHNERTGATETLSITEDTFFLYIILWENGQQVTIL